MPPTIEPLNHQSLKEACIRRLEALILSGEFKIGERLPAERDLAAALNISRPALHEALLDLANKGLVEIVARRGVYVSDFRVNGSLALLSSLFSYHEGALDPAFTQSLVDMRLLYETETSRLAAIHRSAEQLARLHEILDQEAEAPQNDPARLTELDFSFHLQVAVTSANLIYPLILNSFKGVYTNLTGSFFRAVAGTPVVEEVFSFHRSLTRAIAVRNPDKAAAAMVEMLRHGERYLKGAV